MVKILFLIFEFGLYYGICGVFLLTVDMVIGSSYFGITNDAIVTTGYFIIQTVNKFIKSIDDFIKEEL